MAAYDFKNTVFLTGAANPNGFPPDVGREIAFAGRSNAGKSSLINRLCHNAKLTKTAKAPGRTRQINFFETAPSRRLVDLPGYGFANVSKSLRRQWQQLMEAYFNQRDSLRGVILLVDIRRLLQPADWDMIQWCADLPICVVLTKADKLKRMAAQKALEQTQAALHEANIPAHIASALSGRGIAETARQASRWLS